jgi:hypothetical protein
MVGIVVTISPSLSLYRIVVFPAASNPTMRIRISFFPHSLSNNFENVRPMIAVVLVAEERGWCEAVWIDSRTWSEVGLEWDQARLLGTLLRPREA